MKEEIGRKLKYLRIRKGISQEKLAEELNISRAKVSNWETARREISVTDAIILSDYFDKSLDNILNPKILNKDEYIEISKRFFESKNIEFKEKEETLIKIKEIFLLSNSDNIYPLL